MQWSFIWGIGEKNYSQTDWIFKYALRIFEFGTIPIPKESWKIFENLILKTALIQPAILDIVTRIFLTYESYLDADSKFKMKNLIVQVIKNHSSINHNFETAWALWLAKSFEIEIDQDVASQIIETNDSISILILLCMDKEKRLVQGTTNYTSIENNLKDDILFSENWLLAYQGIKNGWLTPIEIDLIYNNVFMNILSNLDVDFFDCSLQLEIYKKTEKVEIIQDNSSAESSSTFTTTKSEETNEEKQIIFTESVSNLF